MTEELNVPGISKQNDPATMAVPQAFRLKCVPGQYRAVCTSLCSYCGKFATYVAYPKDNAEGVKR